MPRINKSVKYYKIKTDTFKAIKHLDHSIDLYKMKETSKNQNCWTDSDYIWVKSFNNIIQAKNYLKGEYNA